MIEVILCVIVLIWMAMVESKLARANRIARASHDLLKEMATEQKKGNEVLEAIATRTGRIAPAPPAPATLPKVEAPAADSSKREPAVYKI